MDMNHHPGIGRICGECRHGQRPIRGLRLRYCNFAMQTKGRRYVRAEWSACHRFLALPPRRYRAKCVRDGVWRECLVLIYPLWQPGHIRNAKIRCENGCECVRPFRGLRRIRDDAQSSPHLPLAICHSPLPPDPDQGRGSDLEIRPVPGAPQFTASKQPRPDGGPAER